MNEIIIKIEGSRVLRFKDDNYFCGSAKNGIKVEEKNGVGWIGGVMKNEDALTLRDFITKHLDRVAREAKNDKEN